MKDHLYLWAPITLTYLDSCHFHSPASTHSEETSHLFLFAPRCSAEYFVIWPFQPSFLTVPFLNFTVDIVFPVLRGPGRTQFEPVNASLRSSTCRYRTGQETQANLPRALAQPLSLRSHPSTAILRVPMMTATGSSPFMPRIQWHRSMSHTGASHEDDPVVTHESGKLTVHQRAHVAYVHAAPTLII